MDRLKMRLSAETKLYIYGVSTRGGQLLRQLEEAGFYVAGMIDQRAGELKYAFHKKVYSPEEMNMVECKDGSLILIALNNARQHEALADSFYRKGFPYIVYLPMTKGGNLSGQNRRRWMYLKITEIQEYDGGIPPYEEAEAEKAKGETAEGRIIAALPLSEEKEWRILYEGKNAILFFCPVNRLFSAEEDYANQYFAGKGMVDFSMVSWDAPIEGLSVYRELYDYLYGRLEYPWNYVRFQGRKGPDIDGLLRDRQELFACYEWHYAYNPVFFQLSPVKVCKRAAGGFHILDGMHRCHYLISKGCRYIPALASRDDVNLWRREENG